MTNHDNTKNRKNENLHALYSILDYCEEPFLCRRKIQLNFLGEEFEQRNCNKMCDNCKLGVKVYDRDVTKEAKVLLEIIQDFEECRANLTVNQLVEICKGRKV